MIQEPSVAQTDVLKEKCNQISALLSDVMIAVTPLTRYPCFKTVHSYVTQAWSLAWNSQTTLFDGDEKAQKKNWKSLNKKIAQAIDYLHYSQWLFTEFKGNPELETALLEEIETLLCDAWELGLKQAPSATLKAPEFTQEGYLKAFPHCFDVSQLEAKEAAIQAESPAPRPEPLPLGTQVIVNSGEYSKYNGVKAEIKLIGHYWGACWHYFLVNLDNNFALWLPDLDFEIDQAWAIENEESAIFGDGQ